MRKIAVSLGKGGTGKSTTAVSLAFGLSMMGNRVLLVDTDVQGNLAVMLGIKPRKGLAEVIEGSSTFKSTVIEARENLWLLAGGQRLGGIKNMIAQRTVRPELVLSEALAKARDYDYAVVDTPPSWDVMNVNTLFYVDELITPVSMEALAVAGLASFIENVETVKKYRPGLNIKYLLPTFWDGRVRKTEDIMEGLKKRFGDILCEPIRYSVALSECPSFGKTIFEYSLRNRGSADYKKLCGRVSRG